MFNHRWRIKYRSSHVFWYFERFWQIIMDGCTNHGYLSIIEHVFTIKSDYGLSEVSYNRIVEWARSILPEGNRLKEYFYTAKSIIKPLSLRYQKINMCLNFCMLYYLETIDLSECRTCGHAWYKPRTGRGRTFIAHKKLRYLSITLRLQRLYISPNTTEHMT